MSAEFNGVVSTIQRYSIDDGPGIRTTVFLKGCQLRCPWCQNPETKNQFTEIYFRAANCIGCGKCVEICPVESAISLTSDQRINRQLCIRCMKCTEVCPSRALEAVGRIMTVSEVMDEVIRDVPFYNTSGGGLTVSGGEPALQGAFTTELLKRAKMQGINTCIETNGYAKSEVWKRMLPYLDLILLDIKHMDPVIHEIFTGVSNELILNNARDLASQVEIIIRVPLIPGFNDSGQFIEELGKFLFSIPRIKEVHLIPVHGYGSSKYVMLGKKEDIYPALNPLSLGNKVEEFKERLEKYGLLVRVLR